MTSLSLESWYMRYSAIQGLPRRCYLDRRVQVNPAKTRRLPCPLLMTEHLNSAEQYCGWRKSDSTLRREVASYYLKPLDTRCTEERQSQCRPQKIHSRALWSRICRAQDLVIQHSQFRAISIETASKNLPVMFKLTEAPMVSDLWYVPLNQGPRGAVVRS